ncbi:uncharacterized protein F4822DRAFT_402920 [Hypoxylon trugodes]|uniref:uncharacterized protein n=1 Tax=Hypoxylon trugodes TaxID=326681 RepID=UPI002194D994|nr:uncharacterized protein F4822DRAFT_402920 [Hypoxylon trugodes]KAI1388466.1 hypothetical protein F4822DRAFT_402920 [Hypoxylon trugodes]
MDEEDTMEVEAWRRTHLGDEPIYCAAPSPSNPDDIICLGSDEELDDDAKVEKRLRYEAQALRYLKGKPIQIVSASLRGPFDKASGWENPWLPKPKPAIKPSVLKPFPRRHKSTAIKERLRRVLDWDNTTSGTENSLDCHLPSPVSNRELPLYNNDFTKDKHNRVHAWAQEVSLETPLERDSFWAPSHVVHEKNDEMNRKRPAGNEWLKKKASKRKRLTSSQDAVAGSSPTPMSSAQSPVRSRAMPVGNGQAKKLTLPKKGVSQSFELATPSSTGDHSSRDAQFGKIETSTKYAVVPVQDMSPKATGGTGVDLKRRRINSILDGSLNTSGREHEEASRATTSDSERTLEDEVDPALKSDQEEDDISFESHLDSSFHFRARPSKRKPSVTAPEAPITGTSSQLAQTTTAEPSVQEKLVSTSATQIEGQPTLVIQAIYPERQIREPEEMTDLPEYAPNEQAKDDNVDNNKLHPLILLEGEEESSENQRIRNSDESTSQSNEPISCTAIAEAKPSSEKQPPSGNSSPIHAHSISAQVMEGDANVTRREDKPVEDTIVETRQVDSASFADDEYTLVDTNGDFNKSLPHETELNSISHTTKDRVTMSISNAEPHDRVQSIGAHGEQEIGQNTEPISNITPPSELEQVGDVLKTSIEKQGDVEVKMEIATSVEEATQESVPAQTTLLDSPAIFMRQSPWVYELSPGADLTPEYVKSEPDDNQSFFSLLSSHASFHDMSRIRPSQQSPWAGEVLGAVGTDGQSNHPASLDTGFTSQALAAAVPQEPQSPWGETGIAIAPQHKHQPISPMPAARDDNESIPQQPMATTIPEYKQPENRINGPSTPPRVHASPARTPDFGNSIKLLALFNTPSPRKRRESTRQHTSTGRTRSILSRGVYSNPLNNRSDRRVSFASLPNEIDDDSLVAHDNTRVASPPLQTKVNFEEDEDIEGTFQTHFDAMKRRASERVQFRFQPRLLPSSSQQKPMTPTVGAMAEAFRNADAQIAQVPSAQEQPAGHEEESVDVEMCDREQFPWQKEAEVDDVADVLNNLDQFLDAWDVDTELQRVR